MTSFPPIASEGHSRPPSSPYNTARMPRPPSGSMLLHAGPTRPNSSATARSTRSYTNRMGSTPSSQTKGRGKSASAGGRKNSGSGNNGGDSPNSAGQQAQHPQESSFVGTGSYMGTGVVSPRGWSTRATASKTGNNGGVYYQNQHVPAPPRSLLTQRIVDIEAATAPITAAQSFTHLLRHQNSNFNNNLNAFGELGYNGGGSSGGPNGTTGTDGRNGSNGSAYNALGGANALPEEGPVSIQYQGKEAPFSYLSGRRGNSPTQGLGSVVSNAGMSTVGSANSPPRNSTDPSGMGGVGPLNITQLASGNGGGRNSGPNTPRSAAMDSGTLFRPNGRNCVRSALGGKDCDAIEAAYGVFGPALANLSTAQTLSTLERECHVAQNEERFMDAQICHDLLNQVAQNCADRAQRVVQDKIKKLQPVQAKFEENHDELVQFTKLWEKELQNYDAKGEAAMVDLKQKHARKVQEEAQLLESKLANTQPHYSRLVIDLRIELGKLVALKQFREADGVNKELVQLERKETERFEQTLNKRYRRAMKVLSDAQQLEMVSLKGRIAAGREELCGQRRADYNTLIQRHAIRVGDVDRKARAQLKQEHKHLQRQAVLMARRPANAVDMFSEYEERRRQEQQMQKSPRQQQQQWRAL